MAYKLIYVQEKNLGNSINMAVGILRCVCSFKAFGKAIFETSKLDESNLQCDFGMLILETTFSLPL